MNHPCPNQPCSTDVLASALVGDLPPDREAALQRHLEDCAECSAALERMAGGADWCSEAALLLGAEELDDETPARDDTSLIDFTVEHLEPADDPGLLGRLGGYDVQAVIGRGGMGVVLKAFDRELKRCVAIKVLAPHLAQSPLAKKRFAREAQAAAAVVHPHVLAIHQVQASGRLPFLVMPLVAGESLAQRLAAQGTLDIKETLRIGMQAAAGLAAAHEQGLVHRDVKPANILLEKGVERAVLTDFGLARAADDATITRWGFISGTPQYMSPEQARGETLDGRSDLFSLGCVLYEMATGVSPFRCESTMATLRRLIDDAPQEMTALNPELPSWFVAIVGRLLAKDPAARFTTAKEVSELLEGCLAHVQQPASVPLPKGVPEPLAGFVHSSRGRFLIGGLAMLALLAVGLAWMFFGPPGDSSSGSPPTGDGLAQAPPAVPTTPLAPASSRGGAPAYGVTGRSEPGGTGGSLFLAPGDVTPGAGGYELYSADLVRHAQGEPHMKAIFQALLPVSCADAVAKTKEINWNSCTSCHAAAHGGDEVAGWEKSDPKETQARVARLEAAIIQISRLLAERQKAPPLAPPATGAAPAPLTVVADSFEVKLPGKERNYVITAGPRGAMLTANNQQSKTLWTTRFTEVLPIGPRDDFRVEEMPGNRFMLSWSPRGGAANRGGWFTFHFDASTGKLIQQAVVPAPLDPKWTVAVRPPVAGEGGVPSAEPETPGVDARLRDLERALTHLGLIVKLPAAANEPPPAYPAGPDPNFAPPAGGNRFVAEVGGSDVSALGVRYLDAIAEARLAKSRLARIGPGIVSEAEIEEAQIALDNAQQKERLLASLIENGLRAAAATQAAAQEEHRRLNQVYRSGAIPLAELDAAQARLRAAQERVLEFEAILKAKGSGAATPTGPPMPGGADAGYPRVNLGWERTSPAVPTGPVVPPGASPRAPGGSIPGLPGGAAEPTTPELPGARPAPPGGETLVPKRIQIWLPELTPAQRAAHQSTNNLKQIGLALHNYEATHGNLPAAFTIRDGRPLLSWRVEILPYIEQQELYREFHHDEPWDSEHNLKLVEKMPALFAVPGRKLKRGCTGYLAPVGKGLVFDGEKKCRFNQILDGTSNTIAIVQAPAEREVPWTKPEDLPIDLARPAAAFAREESLITLFCDGSVRTFRLPIDAKRLASLLQIGDGDAVP